MKKQTGLGKGISALIIDDSEQQSSMEIDINKIEPNRNQPRRHFDEETIKELADSIKEHGIIQPIIVNKEDGYYAIIAGERRWRAARLLKLKTVPVIIKEYNEREKIQIALVENIQREGLNPIEQAIGFRMLIDEYFFTQEDIAEKIGKSRSAVANILRLLSLDERVQEFLTENKLSEGAARLLLTIDDKDQQFDVAVKVVENDMSVREVSELIKSITEPQDSKSDDTESKKTKQSPVTYKAVEQSLKELFGTKVSIKEKNEKGKIQIEYYSHEELERLLDIMNSLNGR